MMALDRRRMQGYASIACRRNAIEANLGTLFRREMPYKPGSNTPRWVSIKTETGPLRAIAFVADRKGGRYVNGLSVEQIADTLAAAVGQWGSMADYLYST